MQDSKMCQVKKWHVFSAFLFTVTLLMFIYFVRFYPNSNCPKETFLCITKECILSASILISNMNKSVDPCEDFYEFVCSSGEFDDDDDMTYSPIEKQVTKQIKIILEEKLEPENHRSNSTEVNVFQLVQNFYKSCLKQESLNLTQVLQQALNELKLSWPVIRSSYYNETLEPHWTQRIYKIKQYGLSANYLLNFSIASSIKNSSIYQIYVTPPNFELDRAYYLNLSDPKLLEYVNKMYKTVQLLTNNENNKNTPNEVSYALHFETELAKATYLSQEKRDLEKLYNPVQIKQLKIDYPNIPWLSYLNKMLNISGSSVILDRNVSVIITEPKYLAKLDMLLKFTWFTEEILANYIMGRAVYEMLNILEVFDENDCIESVQKQFSDIVGVAYLQRSYKNLAHEDNIYEMEHYVKEEMLKLINQTVGLDVETKDKVYKKLENLTSYIGFSEGIYLNETKDIAEEYEGLEISENDYFLNMRNLNKFKFNYNWWGDETEFRKDLNPSSVNAYCDQPSNYIEIPAAILQGFVYNSYRPMYMNFAVLGWTIGHEQAHTLDDIGIQYDINGVVGNWWNNSESKSFYQSRVQCLKEQYGNYSIPEIGMSVNGESTIGENIADNIGLVAAYKAYKAWTKYNEEEMVLPGLNYTVNQLFWITAASKYCGNQLPTTLESDVLTEAHSPRRYRVNGSIRNAREFSEDFNCPLGSKMNPINKCKVFG